MHASRHMHASGAAHRCISKTGTKFESFGKLYAALVLATLLALQFTCVFAFWCAWCIHTSPEGTMTKKGVVTAYRAIFINSLTKCLKHQTIMYTGKYG